MKAEISTGDHIANQQQLEAEASHFDARDMADRRKVSWSRLAAPHVREDLWGKSDRLEFLKKNGLKGRPGLALACGDMSAEAKYFQEMESSEVDANDVSKKTLERAKERCAQLGLKVNIEAADVNKLNLPKNHYGLVVVVHSFHHFEAIDRVAKQVADSLLPGGIFLLVDYVGPRYLQFTPRQLRYANKAFKKLPLKLQIDRHGDQLDSVHPPLRWGLSANEAIEAPLILPTIEKYFDCLKGILYGGLMHPVLERVSGSFDPERSTDAKIIKNLWKEDQRLINELEIEPNFCEMVLVKKGDPLSKKYKPIKLKYRLPQTDERYDWLTQTASVEIWRLRQKVEDLRAAIEKRDKIIASGPKRPLPVRAIGRLRRTLKR